MKIKLPPSLSKKDLDRLLEDASEPTATPTPITEPMPASIVEPAPATADNSRGKYIAGYQKEHYDLMRINLPKGMKDRIRAEAQSRGLSANKLMTQIIQDFLDKEC